MSGYESWGSKPVVVSVAAPDDSRDHVTFVSEATAFWEGNDSRYLEYEIDYEIDTDVRNPDLMVRSIDDIPVYSRLDNAAGCAPHLTNGRQMDRLETIYVHTGYGDDSTVDAVVHKPGHTPGPAHGNEPVDLMNATGTLYMLPRMNATGKAFPWDDLNFMVHVDDMSASDPSATREQVCHALDHFEGGASGMPDNLTYTCVDSPADVEACIFFANSPPCAAGAISCVIASGYDPDSDGALGTYSGYRVAPVNPDTEAVGWHVGYWTTYYPGAEADDDKPESFRNVTYGERRSERWTQRRCRIVSRALCAIDGGFHPDESAESFSGMASAERIATPTDRYGGTHLAFDEESPRGALTEFGGADVKCRTVARQVHDLADSGQAEADRGVPLTGDEIMRNMRDASSGDPATR